MEETMSHLFPHKPKDYHAYWTIEGLSEFIARVSLGSFKNFNHDSILKTNKTNQNKSSTFFIFLAKFQRVICLKLGEEGGNVTLAFFLTYHIFFCCFDLLLLL